MADQNAPHEEIEAKLSDYYDGMLSGPERDEIAQHLDTCDGCRAAYAQLEETMKALAGMKGKKEDAPAGMTAAVTDTINRRSAGRFFGRKTLGDRVPFGVLLIVAIVVLGVTAAILYSSSTGNLRTRTPEAPHMNGHGGVVPTP
ncbi:MAG TPA: anti-sigma factor [Kofleriaceae bacterium]|jgi:anti-sigma factor RsiW|nr:anti-sigma factor [Kofleriaceae bacterium]